MPGGQDATDIERPGAVEGLICALDDPGTAVEAAASLGTLRASLEPAARSTAGEALVSAFVRHLSPYVGDVVRGWEGADVPGLLVAALEEAPAATRREVEVLLATLGPGAVPALVEALRHPDPGVRLVGVRALHRIRRTVVRQIQEGHRRAVVEAARGVRTPDWMGGSRAGLAGSPESPALEEDLHRIDTAAVPLRVVAHTDPEADVRTTAQKAVLDFPAG